MSRIILVVDYGTSNVRVNAVDAENGSTVASNSIKYRPVTTEPGYCELDAESMWESTQECMQRTVADINWQKDEVYGVSFSFFGDSMIPVDSSGNAVHNLFLCFDPRGAEEAKEINEKVGTERILKLIGDVYESGCTGAKILYFKRHMKELDERTAKYYTIQQFILRKLGMSDVNDVTMACRKSMLDNEKKEWAGELLEAVGITREQLGDIVEPTEVLGTIKKFGRVEFPYEIQVCPGAHDSDCGYVGLGVGTDPDINTAEVAGTFDHIGMIVKGYVNCHRDHPDKDIWSGCGPLKDTSSCLSAYATSGALLEWFMTEIIGNAEQETYRELWSRTTFDGTGTVSLGPMFLQGEGEIKGLSITTTKYELFQAVIEMLTFETRRCIELCEMADAKGIHTVRIGGGGAREDKWVQLRADITGRTYQRTEELESSALGAAMLASVGFGIYSSIEKAGSSMVRLQKAFEPDPHVKHLYEDRYLAYLKEYYS